MQRMQSVFSWLPAWSTPRGMTAAEAREEAQPHHEVIDVDGSSVVEISRDVSDSLEDSLLTPTVRLGPAPAPFCADELREFETRRDWVQRMIAKLQRENDFQSPRDVIDHLLQKGRLLETVQCVDCGTARKARGRHQWLFEREGRECSERAPAGISLFRLGGALCGAAGRQCGTAVPDPSNHC